jgi:hypothetical protein
VRFCIHGYRGCFLCLLIGSIPLDPGYGLDMFLVYTLLDGAVPFASPHSLVITIHTHFSPAETACWVGQRRFGKPNGRGYLSFFLFVTMSHDLWG